ncbi:MAG: iron ABC transporter permease [Calditrichaeota bacterium]|nr:iron ABC transporter permease [Calditrichota bacterium]
MGRNPIGFRIRFVLLGLVSVAGAVVVLPLIGSQALDFHQVWNHLRGTTNPDGVIFFQVRLPRVMLGLLAGGCLSLAGVVFQALLRNPLATPYTLGVSSGGALGALLAIKLGIGLNWWGFSTLQIAAFTGSLLTIALVYGLSRGIGQIAIHIMILAGVTLSYFFGALILLLHYLADFTETQQMIRWMMGGLDITDYGTILRVLPLIAVAVVGLGALANTLNLLSTSEVFALSKGVDVPRVQKWAFLLTSLLTGTVVALTGPIGFVGLIVPHFLRMVVGPDHRLLIPGSFLYGGVFLATADTVARTVLAPINLPVGILTAMLGGPFFLWLLFRQRKHSV